MTTDGAALALRERVRQTYGEIARAPAAHHAIPVGRRLAERAGYPAEWLNAVPASSIEVFAGVSCLPCLAEIAEGAVVLDLGCGGGLDALLAAPRCSHVLAVDFSEEMLARARDSAEVIGATSIRFAYGEAESIPAKTGSVDVALINGIFNLNPMRDAIFSELARVVRPGGKVFAAELILKQPVQVNDRTGDDDWFA
jgi:arsenite methyltransferase